MIPWQPRPPLGTLGVLVGAEVGAAVGDAVGEVVGDAVGAEVGAVVTAVGAEIGLGSKWMISTRSSCVESCVTDRSKREV